MSLDSSQYSLQLVGLGNMLGAVASTYISCYYNLHKTLVRLSGFLLY